MRLVRECDLLRWCHISMDVAELNQEFIRTQQEINRELKSRVEKLEKELAELKN